MPRRRSISTAANTMITELVLLRADERLGKFQGSKIGSIVC